MIDPYLYPGTDILINKQGIKDEKKLNEMEANFVAIRLRELVEKPLPGNYDTLVAASAIFSDLGDLSKPEYLINIIQDAMEKDTEQR